jgi:hypothetical protein
MKVDVKMLCNNASEITNLKAHMLGGHREAEMAILKQSNMKTSW